MTCPGRPRRGSPSLRTTPWAAALPGSGPGARRGEAGGASLGPLREPRAAPSSARWLCCAQARAAGGPGLADVGAWARAGARVAALRAHPVTRGQRHLGWGLEGAKRWRRRRGPGAGNQRLGMAARRVAPGQARGMKGSLSSGDTAGGFLLPPPPAALIGAGC